MLLSISVVLNLLPVKLTTRKNRAKTAKFSTLFVRSSALPVLCTFLATPHHQLSINAAMFVRKPFVLRHWVEETPLSPKPIFLIPCHRCYDFENIFAKNCQKLPYLLKLLPAFAKI
jgi:hypothetical protein